MARAKLLPPTLDYLEALRVEMESLHSQEDAQIERMRRVRELLQPVQVDDNWKLVQIEVRMPHAADEGHRVAGMLTVNPAKINVSAGTSETADRNATLREHWTREVLRVAGSREIGPPTMHMAVDANVNDGGCWTKLLFVRDLWSERYSIKPETIGQIETLEDDEADSGGKANGKAKPGKVTDFARYNADTEEAKKRSGPPFAWINVDVRSIYPLYQGGRLGEVLEVQEVPTSSSFRRYRLKRDESGDIVPEETGQVTSVGQTKAVGTIQKLEHWDADFASVAIIGRNNAGAATGRVVKQWRHGYGRPPYFFAPGRWMSHWKNRKVGWGISEQKRWLIEYLAYLRTIHAQVCARDAFGVLFREVPDGAAPLVGSDGKPRGDEQWELRRIINGAPGEKLVPVQFSNIAPALREEIALVTKDLENLSTPRAIGNVSNVEGGAGFGISQVLSEGRIMHDPNVQSIERMLEEVTRFLWFLMRTKVKEPVWVYQEGEQTGWLVAGPEDLSDSVGVRWELNPERASDKLIQNRYWSERLANKTAHQDQAISAMGDNPDEVRLGLARDRIRQTPWYTAMQDQMVAHEAGRGDLLQVAVQAQQVAQTGQLPGQPPQGMGTEGIPDMGALTQAPGGTGAVPAMVPLGKAGRPWGAAVPGNKLFPKNLPVPGAPSSGAIVPQKGAAAGVQKLGPGG